MNNDLLYTIESFPPLPESINQLNELCQVDDVDLKAVIKVIEADPILYTDILRYSNVPYHGFRYPITSISQAISLFGVSAIRGMSLTAALKAHPYSDISAYGVSINEWFGTMERQQRFLEIWLLKKHRSILHSLGGLTFILEIGRLVASYALMMTKKSYSFYENEAKKLDEEEKNIIGRSGDELAAELFEFWNFEKLFFNCLNHSLNPEKGMEPQTCAVLECARTLFRLKETREFEEIEPILEKYNFLLSDARIAYEIMISEDE
ncbi:HDOD domain-containing protein [Sulfuricurvum sp.]|uniref:HDOD domain-containing protein n=1 Tax=Sulfuricurvum sp. TaxID=2025608 RepID=UPI002618A705|nr:HDOD domain-containing protein [Sulfuricurvum sp.]MDD2781739.1 HDOD domain-containing protein [Sulfuricurvum sp.]